MLMQVNQVKDALEVINEPTAILDTLNMYTGLSKQEIYADIQSKMSILKWLVEKNVTDINKIRVIMSKYYLNKPFTHLKGV